MKMATGGDTSLGDDLIERLAQVIDTTKMETIASVHLGIPLVTMKNERFDNQGNATAFKPRHPYCVEKQQSWRQPGPGQFQPSVIHLWVQRPRGIQVCIGLRRSNITL